MRSLLLIATLVAVPLTADAKPKKGAAKGAPKTPKVNKAKEAKKHEAQAAKAHKAGKFDVALIELQAAYAIDPQPKFLFAIAQVQVKLDNCPEAITNYAAFNDTLKPKDKAKKAVVAQAIEACKKKVATTSGESDVFRKTKPDDPVPPADPPKLETTTTTPPPAEPLPVDPTPPVAPPVEDNPLPPSPMVRAPEQPTRRGRKPFYKDVLGDVLVLGGVTAGVFSVITYGNAKSDLDAAEDAPTHDGYEDLVDRAQSRRTTAVILAGGGAVLVAAGILRWSLRGGGESAPRSVSLAPTSGGGLITWGGGF